MRLIRKILIKILGLKGYLKLVSSTYIKFIRMGLMKKKYGELYFVNKVLNEGDTAVDIGANLAYYSYFMSRNIGKSGQLYAVEPIPLFADIWKKNMAGHGAYNVKLFNCALGNETKESVKMSIPIVNGMVRHGLTKVVENADLNEAVLSFDVPMKVADDLMSGEAIQRLDFVKCDVEGYEQYVIPSLKQSIEKFKPMFQIELGGKENRESVVDFLVNLGYDIFILEDQLLNSIQKNDIFSLSQDFYFIHKDEIEKRKTLIRK